MHLGRSGCRLAAPKSWQPGRGASQAPCLNTQRLVLPRRGQGFFSTTSNVRAHGRKTSATPQSARLNEQGELLSPPKVSPQEIAQARQFFADSKFVYSAAELRHHPINEHAVPEIVVLGASNAGKSTLLNKLFGKTDLARVSNEPGKTTLMNAYGVGKPLKQILKEHNRGVQPPKHGLVMLDTPGYGFGSRTEWGDNILSYLQKRKALRGAIVLLSAEKKLSAEDEWILTQLARVPTRILIVLTKSDKAKASSNQKLRDLADSIRRFVKGMEQLLSVKIPYEICVTAHLDKRKVEHNDMFGIRSVIMDMASISLGGTKVEEAKENIQYTGEVISFDDITWKS